MFIVGRLLISIADILHIIINLLYLLIIIRAVLSWFTIYPYHPIVHFLHNTTEPILAPIRRRLSFFLYNTGIDISPLIAIFLLLFLDKFFVGILKDIGYRLI